MCKLCNDDAKYGHEPVEAQSSANGATLTEGLGDRTGCKHANRECTYESDDGEFERWQCKDCGARWGVEIAQ